MWLSWRVLAQSAGSVGPIRQTKGSGPHLESIPALRRIGTQGRPELQSKVEAILSQQQKIKKRPRAARWGAPCLPPQHSGHRDQGQEF